MAITEDFYSREQHETTEGITVRLVFSCTWADWTNGTDGSIVLPVVGDALTVYLTGWPVGYDELVCTDRKAQTLENTNCKVTCFYSTESSVARQRRPDQSLSWKLEIIPDGYMEQITGWRDTDGVWTTWESFYGSRKTTGMPDDPLPLMRYRTGLTAVITCYSSKWLMPFIFQYHGCVNKVPFLRPFADAYITNENFEIDWGDWETAPNASTETSDTHQWLLVDVQSERVLKKSWEYKFSFKHAGYDEQNERMDWYHQHNIDDAMPFYPKVDFFQVFNKMAAMDTDISGGPHS